MKIIREPEPAVVDAALEALRPGQRVATDADGTLWAGDVGDDSVRWVGAELEPTYDVAAYLRRMETDYEGGCREAAEALRGRAPLRAALARFLAPRLRPRDHLVSALRACIERGVEVWIVSASPRLAAEVGADLVGLQGARVLAIETPGTAPGVFTEPVTVGEGKVAAWRSLGLPPPAVALGDSKWDLPLLESAGAGYLLSSISGSG